MSRSTWWEDWTFSRPATLSIIDLVASGTLDFKLAGFLWLLMENRVSVLVASAPIFAGKTTLLYSLLDLLPPDLQHYSLRGFAEDFSFTESHKPETTYLISEEISNHQYEYLWGDNVQKTFRLLGQGYRLGATTHARDIRDVAYLLHGYLNVPLSDLVNVGVVVSLYAANGPSYDDEPIRHIDSVTIIEKKDDNIIARMLAVRESTDGGFVYPEENELRKTLFEKFGITYEQVFAEIAGREAFLEHLSEAGIHTREAVREAVTDRFRSR